jgi:hypothetical protein
VVANFIAAAGFWSSGSIAFAPDGSLYGLTSSGDVQVLDTTTGMVAAAFFADFSPSGSIAFGPDGNLYGLTSSGHIEVRNTTGSLVTTLNTDYFSEGSIAFVPEPSSATFVLIGFSMLFRRRARKRAMIQRGQ